MCCRPTFDGYEPVKAPAIKKLLPLRGPAIGSFLIQAFLALPSGFHGAASACAVGSVTIVRADDAGA